MKLVFNLTAKTIEVSGDDDKVIEALGVIRSFAPSFDKVTFISDKDAPLPPSGSNGSVAGVPADAQGTTIRQFCRKLSLDSNPEKIVAIGHYKKNFEKVDSFTPKEMSDWFTQCGFPKPSQMSVAFFDSRKRNGYLESLGHGRWKVTVNGDNLIIGKLNEVDDQ